MITRRQTIVANAAAAFLGVFAAFGGIAPRAAAADGADEAYSRLRETSEAGDYAKAFELGEAFLVDYPDHPRIASALNLAATAQLESSNFERAAALCRRILKEHPDFGEIDEVRFQLAMSLSGGRELEACMKQCRVNLEVAPEDPGADYYRFLIPQSQFRLWRFEEAEKALKELVDHHPDSAYAVHARRYLERINPAWSVDENGIAGYTGKYDGDYRLEAGLSALPAHIKEGRQKIRERLGVDIDFGGMVNFIFRDAGADSRGGLMAETFTISRDYKPVTVIQFYTEHVVIDPEGYRKTVIHEMKHAGFKSVMGRAYDDIPDWIAEGLAQWAAEELERRLISKLTNESFAGRDPRAELNGVANPAHDVGDYLEDVLAMEWLEKRKAGGVIAFSKGLVEGRDWQELLEATSGLDPAETIRQMDEHCQQRAADALGRAGRRLIKHRDTYFAKAGEGAGALTEWLREEGNREFAEWVEKYPDHALTPVAWFYSGRGLILTGSFAKGRQSLRNIIDSEQETSLCDDALFWEGYAFQQEKRMDDAERSFRVLLRDYSWSNSASKVQGKFEPAGPEQERASNP